MCADNFDDDWEDMNEEEEDEVEVEVEDRPKKGTKTKQKASQAKNKINDPVDEQTAMIEKMATSVNTMAGAYAKSKQEVSPNAGWCDLLAHKLDKLDIDVQEDLKIEIDNLVHAAIREQRRKNERNN